MAIIKGVKRLDRSDFPSDVPEWLDYLLDPLNGFMDTSITALRANLNFDNLRRALKTFTFTHNVELEISHKYNGRVGIEVLYCEDFYKVKHRQVSNNTIGVTFLFDGGVGTTQEVTLAIVADIKGV